MASVNENKELVFGLDIGTRSIVGTVGYKDGNRFKIVAQYAKEHETRAMIDGQIHDIHKVGETILEVKERLEREIGGKLNAVCIAAAGRVLRTVTSSVEHSFGQEKEITTEDIYALDTMGVEKAYEEFVKSNDSDMQFYCVGYTTMRYYMNGYTIGNLEGHKAKNIGVDLIATFLPDDVVDGLYKAVGQAKLSVANLTLEPIAAIQVAIPEKFRMLNLALVDVGAGTSDISITKDGAITAYGMIPVAGDSLTEMIVQHCLVEFDTAEKIKRQLANKEVIEYSDILGLPQTITAKEIMDILDPCIDKMTAQVAECIKDLNGDKPVSAVFVVGGGGMIPGYTRKLSAHLGIPEERVAIRGQEVMQLIDFEFEGAQKDSLMVTPIGICLTYYEQSNNFIFVTFNDDKIKLYDNGRLAVVDAAIACGFPNDSLFPGRGEGISYTVNGKNKMTRGVQGEAAVITINGQEADIHSKLNNGDKVVIVPSTKGEKAKPELDRLPELHEKVNVTVAGNPVSLPKFAIVNGERQLSTYIIQDGDSIEVPNWYTLSQILEFADIHISESDVLLVNEVPAQLDTKVYDGFSVSIRPMTEEEKKALKASEEADEEEGFEAEEVEEVEETIEEVVEEVPVEEKPKKEAKDKEKSKEEVKEESKEEAEQVPEEKTVVVIVNNKPVVMTGKPAYVFVDIFDYIDFDLRASHGRAIVTLLNDRNAQFMENLEDGDVVKIFWKE